MARRRSFAGWLALGLFVLMGLVVSLGLWIGIGVHDEYGWDASVQVLISTLVLTAALGLASWKLLRPSIRDDNKP
jgi:uncharacterized membrane protein YqjE